MFVYAIFLFHLIPSVINTINDANHPTYAPENNPSVTPIEYDKQLQLTVHDYFEHYAHQKEPATIMIQSGYTNDPYKCRRILSQVCAMVAQSLLILDVGMIIAVPTIVIGVLHNAKEGLSLDDSQSSWFCSIMLLCQPFGSVLSGCAQGILGRKKSMLFACALHPVGWYLLYSAQSVLVLHAGSLIMGIGIGFLEAPLLAYMGEVCEPYLRGTLATIANSHVVIGQLLEFTLGYFFPWKRAMLVSCAMPVITVIVISLVPESPVWLLSKGRKHEALSSLRWLRGWVSADEVSDEFQRLEIYCEQSKYKFKNNLDGQIKRLSGYNSVPDDEYVTSGEPGIVDSLRDLLRPAVLKPLRLVAIYFFFCHTASLTALRPYMVEVFAQLEVPLSPNMLTILSSVLQGAGALTCVCLIHSVGKRTLSLVSMTCCALCCLLLGAYTYATNWYSIPSIPLFLFCALYYCMNLGIIPISWLLISEVFPTRGRGVAGGVCSGIFYIQAFLVSKTWLNLQNLVELHGCFWLYGTLGGFGVLYLYFYLPETEGKTLAEIEKHFSNKNQKY